MKIVRLETREGRIWGLGGFVRVARREQVLVWYLTALPLVSQRAARVSKQAAPRRSDSDGCFWQRHLTTCSRPPHQTLRHGRPWPRGTWRDLKHVHALTVIGRPAHCVGIKDTRRAAGDSPSPLKVFAAPGEQQRARCEQRRAYGSSRPQSVSLCQRGRHTCPSRTALEGATLEIS